MVTMVNFTVKGIPDDLYEKLKLRAREHRRSVNSELIVVLELALRHGLRDPTEVLARADAVRGGLAVPPYTQASLTAARLKGRRR